ncbi:MAG TPA: VanW family protein [Firmicutes bacterium]|nr:VanW family protein [Bacillota bacterium]
MEESKQKRKLPAPALAGIIAGVALVVLVGAYWGLCKWVQDNGRLLPGSQARDSAGTVVLDLGGVAEQDAVARMAEYMEQNQNEQTITLRYGDGERAQLSGQLLASDPQASVEHGMGVKADQPFLKLGLLWLGLGGEQVSLPLAASDFTPEGERQAKQLIGQIAQELYVAPVDFTYELGTNELTLQMGVDGERVDEQALLEQVLEALASGQSELQVETVAAPAKELSGQILAGLVNVEPQASTLQADGTITPTVVGVRIDAQQAQEILDGIGPGESCAIPVTYEQPDLSGAEQYLYQDLLSTTTNYLDGVYARSYNVALAASSCNGVVIMPGEVFSYLDTIGSPSQANGYQVSTGYAGGETVDMVGGGICQVSSSLYYCSVYANLEIVNRACHAFIVGYLPNGLDATVYYPTLDYQFRNNTDYPIKIVAGVSGNQLTVSFYGTKTDDTYVQTQRYTLSTTPWQTVYEPDSSVPQGTTQVKTTPYTGYEVNVYRCVYDGQGNLISRTFENYSKYAKRDRVILFNPADAASLGLTPEGNPLPAGPAIEQPEAPSQDPQPSVSPEPQPSEPTPSTEPSASPEPAPSASAPAGQEGEPSEAATGG